ncbi:MAG: murein biosynthesis integral membrane protein MurJ [Planctomycetaceae bacterium]
MTDRDEPAADNPDTPIGRAASVSPPVDSQSDSQSDSKTTGGLFSGLRIVSLCTLLSRVLGLVREIAMAALFGNGRVLDAFTVAFAIPNLARALFGEGALSTAFLPLFVREQDQNGPEAANRFAGAVFVWAAIGLSALVAVAEMALASVLWLAPLSADARLWLTLTALMLPYLVLICLTAQLGAVLNAGGRFAVPALLPVLFNICLLGAIWWVHRQDLSAESQAMWLALAVVLTGVVQLGVAVLQMRRAIRPNPRWRESKDRLRELLRVMAPIILGLSITQLNTLCDRLIALGFSKPEKPEAVEVEGFLEGVSRLVPHDWRPLEAGTASALNQGQRLYQFPLGLLGVALGTVIFPLLTRHAERGDMQRLRDDLSLGLRLVFVIGLPASAGLWLLADQLSVVLFQRGKFTALDARQTADMIACYGIGVWAFCGSLIVQRGYYAIGDRRTPLKIGIWVMLINLVLNLSLIWVIGARGLALSTSLCGIIQFGLCLLFIQDRVGRLPWWSLASNAGRAFIGTVAMTAVAWWVLDRLTEQAIHSTGRLLQLGATLLAALLSYALLTLILRLDEFWMLWRRHHDES